MDARISLCMIVKDEAQNIRRCLESVQGVVDEIIVVDTGSTDETCQIAGALGARVHSFPWNENFSDARNASLELATGDWILFLDADEELARESREALRRLTSDDSVEGYFVKIVNYLGNEGWIETCPDLVFRLFRNRREYRFRGAIHEQIANVILEKNSRAAYRIAEEMVIIHYGYLDRQINDKDKKNRNLKIIQKELGENPESRLLRFHYGVELFRAERYAEAAGELTRAANGIDPDTIYLPKLLRYIVMSHQSAGQPEKALDVARLGLQFFPNFADLYYYSGLLFLDVKRYALARESFLKAVSMPEQPAQYASFGGVRGFRSYYHLGQISEIFLDHEDALRHYLSCLRDNPDFTPALENIVRILKPRENPDYAKECLEKVFELRTPRANQMMGDIYFRKGAYSLALEYFNRDTDNGAGSPEIQLWKAICLIQLRRHLEALRIIDSFKPGSNLYPLALLNKLFCFWVQGKKQKVRSILAELRSLGLAEDTDNVLTLFLNSQDKRRNAYKVTLGQDGVALLLDIIKRLLDMDETDRAIHLLNRVDPESLEEHRLTVARLFYDYGFKEKAEILLREYVTENQDGEAHFLLAEICHETGNYIEAGQHYRFALEMNPDEPRYYVRQINLYDNWRKKVLQEAIEKYPDLEVLGKLSEEAPVN